MKAFILVGLLAAGLVHAEDTNPVIPLNARVYIDADGGFNIFLTAAMEKQHVPLTVTADKSKAEFSLEGFSVRDARPDDEASVRLVDLKSGDVVFTWSVEKKSTAHSLQNAAEACVKQVRAAVVKAQQKRLGMWRSKDPAMDF
jgi:hypothetical protein